MSRCRLVSMVVALQLIAVGSARAQPPEAGRVDVSAGLAWIGPLALGHATANETAPGGSSRPLFSSDTTLTASAGAAAAVSVRVTRLLSVGLGFGYNRTRLRSQITGDAEAIPDVTVDSPVTQYLFEGGLVVRPGRLRVGAFLPFMSGGVGYLRQLNGDRTLVQSGHDYYAGGGLDYLWRHGGRGLKAGGLRMEARALAMRGGVAPDTRIRVTPAVAASLFVRF